MYYSFKHKKTPKTFLYEKNIVRTFKNSLSTYGRRRIQKSLKKKGIFVSQYSISKVLKKHGLEGKHGRKKLARNIYIAPNFKTENLIKKAPEGSKIYSADMSVFSCKNGQKLIVSGIIDITSRIVVGYSYSTNYKSDFVKNSFETAFNNFGVPDYVHTDNGSQYKSEMVHDYIIKCGAKHSFSRVGTPNDNQYIETFWKTMKIEIGNTKRMSLGDLKNVVDYYMHFYNNYRLHSSIGYIPPIQMKNTL